MQASKRVATRQQHREHLRRRRRPRSDAGDVQIDVAVAPGGAAIKTNGGTFTSSGVNFENGQSPIQTAGGPINIDHSGNVTIGSLDASGGDVTIKAGGAIRASNGDDGVADVAGGLVRLVARAGDIGPIDSVSTV
jgi:hypothetical protein